VADRPARSLKYRQNRDRLLPPSPKTSPFRDSGVGVVPSSGPYRDEVNVSFTVMAHPKRREWAEQIAAEIGCSITWDQKNDRHDTGLRAIKAYDPSADYHVVVQDDVLLPQDFVKSVRRALLWVPSAPVSFYYGGKGNGYSKHVATWQEAKEAGASWLKRKGPVWGPAIAYPTRSIERLISYFEASEVQNYDRRVMKYYLSVGQSCWYSIPSLVQHRQEDNPSLCGHDRGLRQAREFVGPQSALEVDWSGPIARSRQ
jgi:hypothetical protein